MLTLLTLTDPKMLTQGNRWSPAVAERLLASGQTTPHTSSSSVSRPMNGSE